MLICQYNVQSLKTNKSSLEFFLNTYKVDICAVSEIFSFDESKLYTNIMNYNSITKTRDDNYGGVAIFLKKCIKFKKLLFESPLDILICETTNLNKNIIASVYFTHSVKNDSLRTEIIKLLTFLEFGNNVIICGDFNARSPFFGDTMTSSRGNLIHQLFEQFDFRYLNSGEKTFKKSITDPLCVGSVLDLTFTNSTLAIKWYVHQGVIGGSHHYLVMSEIFTCNSIKFISKQKLLEKIKNTSILPEFDNIENNLQNAIKDSSFVLDSSKHTPKTW